MLLAIALALATTPPASAQPALNNGSGWTGYPDLNENTGIPGMNALGEIEMAPDMQSLADVEAAFENARAIENSDLCTAGSCEPGATIMPVDLDLGSDYSTLSPSEKALVILNSERSARGLLPFEDTNVAVQTVAQEWAQFLIDNNAFQHRADAHGAIENECAATGCSGNIGFAAPENLYSRSSYSYPARAQLDPYGVERAIYLWMYFDRDLGGESSDQFWGHRHALLWDWPVDDHGPIGSEGFIGIGISTVDVDLPQGNIVFLGQRQVVVWNGLDTNAAWPATAGPDTTKPEILTNPIANATNFPVTITGTATDNTAVNRVRIRIRNVGTGEYYNITTDSWQSGSVYNQIPITPGNNITWTHQFNPTTPTNGTFEITALANDTANNLDATPFPQQRFTIG